VRLKITHRMKQRTKDILDRMLQFGVDTIKLSASLPENSTGWTIARQVIRSATSVGVNYQEAQSARSRAEFVSKAYVALQEASETLYWFRTIERCRIGDPDSLARLTDGAKQLVSMLVAVTGTAKRKPC
jgi:four helix bundle protein